MENDEFNLDESDFDFGDALSEAFGLDPEAEKEKARELDAQRQKKEAAEANSKLTAKGHRSTLRHHMERAKSEAVLNGVLPWHYVEGEAYHVISHGDVDALSYLRLVLKQQKIEYLCVSTWTMAITDAEEFKEWLDAGYIKRIDFYLGERFETGYAPVYDFTLMNLIRHGGRIALCKNHAKVIAGYGERFDFVICGSANLNTNPRIEQVATIIDSKTATFYKEFFDGIKGWNLGFENWKPYPSKVYE